jgi:hypothetical protein
LHGDRAQWGPLIYAIKFVENYGSLGAGVDYVHFWLGQKSQVWFFFSLYRTPWAMQVGFFLCNVEARVCPYYGAKGVCLAFLVGLGEVPQRNTSKFPKSAKSANFSPPSLGPGVEIEETGYAVYLRYMSSPDKLSASKIADIKKFELPSLPHQSSVLCESLS